MQTIEMTATAILFIFIGAMGWTAYYFLARSIIQTLTKGEEEE